MALSLFAVVLAWSAAGDIYRCRDAAGVMRFEDKPCAGVASERLATRGEDSAATRLALRRWLERDRPRRASTAPPAPRAARSGVVVGLPAGGPPVTEAQLAGCSERFLHCAHGTGAVMDACVARLPRCSASGAGACCPQACVSRYQALRQQGHALSSAVRLALLDPLAYACGTAR